MLRPLCLGHAPAALFLFEQPLDLRCCPGGASTERAARAGVIGEVHSRSPENAQISPWRGAHALRRRLRL